MKKKTLWIIIFIILVVIVFISAFFCKGDALPWNKEKDVTPYVPPPGEFLPTATYFSPSAVTPTTEPNLVWIDPDLPGLLLDQLAEMEYLEITDQQEDAATTLVYGDENPITYWVFAAVAPFPTVTDGISLKEIKSAWQGGKNPLSPNLPMFMTEETHEVLTFSWGEPDFNAVDDDTTDY